MIAGHKKPVRPADGHNSGDSGWWIDPHFPFEELPRALANHRATLAQAAIRGVLKCGYNRFRNIGWSKVTVANETGGDLKLEVPNRALRGKAPSGRQVRKLEEMLRGDPDGEFRARPPKVSYVNGGAAKYGNGVRRPPARR